MSVQESFEGPVQDTEDGFPTGPDHLQLYPLPLPDNVRPRPLTNEEESRIDTLSRLQFFLATAPTRWQENPNMITSRISKFQLPNGECISCVLWNGLYHVTGTDIVRALAFRFEAFGRPIHATKKWEEGVFSDLRNLKPGQDACLEEPKSPLLDFLFRNGCIRTQKKQKVFYWFSVPHDRLFLDALERDLKREKANQEPTSIVVGEPARSFKYDPRRSLYDQFAGQNPGLNVLMGDIVSYSQSPMPHNDYQMYHHHMPDPYAHHMHHPPPHTGYDPHSQIMEMSPEPRVNSGFNRPAYTGQSGFIGSPNYKKRRIRARDSSTPGTGMSESARGPSVDVRDTESPDQVADSSFASDESGMPPPPFKKSRPNSRAQSADPRDGDSRNFLCPYDFCRRPFKRLEHLKRHVRTHTQERPYQCQRCPRNFSRQDNLAMHIKTHEKMDREGGVMSEDDMREYSESPAPGIMYDQYSRASSAMPPPSLSYTRHSTLPPNFPAGPPAGGSPFHRAVTPSYGGPQMLGVPSFSPSYDPNTRRHRSVTPYAPVTSSNLAYAQPVIAPPVDMMAAYPTPVSANNNDGSTSAYTVDTMPTPTGIPVSTFSGQGQMDLQTMPMPMQMAVPTQMDMPMHIGEYSQTQAAQGQGYEAGSSARGGAPSGWGWRSYEPGAFVPPEMIDENSADYGE